MISLQLLVAELNRTLCGITWQCTLLGKRENNSAEKKGFLYASLTSPSCQKHGNIENRFLIGCAPCTMKPVYILLAARTSCCRRGSILRHCVQDELTRIKNLFVENIFSQPNLSYPICYYQGGVLTMISSEFLNSAQRSDFFPNLEEQI